MSSRRALVVLAVVLAVAIVPMLRPGRPDSFPLTTYPMFSRPTTGLVELDLALGETATGERRTLSPERIADTDEVIVAGGTVRRAVADGTTEALCARIAARPGSADVVQIVVLTATVDAVAWFGDDLRSFPDETEHTRCEVSS